MKRATHPFASWLRDPASAPAAGTMLLLLAAALLLLPTLGLYPLFDVDEGAFSEATREILQSGDWLSTTLNGAPRYDKPILIYWLQALSVRALGLNEFALRLPSAVAALAWIFAIVRFAGPRFGAAAGWLAGWVAATSLGLLAMSRAATADALLNALLAATMFDLWRFLEGADRAALRRTYLWMALGVLTKGPVAILIPAAVSLAYCLSCRRWRDWARAAFDPLGWLILVALAGPWYAAQLVLHGREFVDGFLMRHNLDRFQTTLEGHRGSLGYYFLVAPLLLLPWSGLLWRALRRVPDDWRDPLPRYLMLWFAFVFCFFSLSGTKLPHYLLYGMTPVFLAIARRVRDDGSATNLLGMPCLLLLLLPAAPAAVQWWSGSGADPRAAFYLGQARRALAAAPPSYYLVTVGCALAALGVAALRAWPCGRRAIAASALLAAATGYAFVPWLGELLNGPVKHAAQFAAQLPGEAVQWEFAAPSFSVYRRQITPARPPRPGELAITRTDRLDPNAPVDRLFQEGGVALVRAR
jgi:4-amino-4-deoxy-L-arabinose transferase-like glycosyltransferase